MISLATEGDWACMIIEATKARVTLAKGSDLRGIAKKPLTELMMITRELERL